MKTTLDINADLLRQAKAAAALAGTSLTRLIEEGLSLRLRCAEQPPPAVPLVCTIPVFHRGTGLRTGVDGCSNRSLLDAADGLDPHA